MSGQRDVWRPRPIATDPADDPLWWQARAAEGGLEACSKCKSQAMTREYRTNGRGQRELVDKCRICGWQQYRAVKDGMGGTIVVE